MFKIKYEKKAIKFIKKLDFSVKVLLDKELKKLEFDPFPRSKKHILETVGSSLLCELVVDKWRIYYTVEDRYIVIEEVEYEGVVKVVKGYSNHKSGNKQNNPNQRKDIGILKRWFINTFKR